MSHKTFHLPAQLGVFFALAVLFVTPSEIAAQAPPQVFITQGSSTISDGGSFDFGDTDVGSFNTVTFMLHNYGFAPIQPTSVPRVSIGGADAAQFLLLDDLPAFIPPGSLAAFTISFCPLSSGVKSAAVTISYLNPDPNSYDFLLGGMGILSPVDSDGDGVPDDWDNCPDEWNPDQADLDGDGIGDSCDPDADGDGYEATTADCDDTDPNVHPGADEICGDGIDQDCDGYDMLCVIDSDGDGIPDSEDTCPGTPNPDQADADGDGIGDVCDLDADGDTYTSADGDCDDGDPNIHPEAIEIYGDGIDQNCDGSDLPCDDPVAAVQDLMNEVRALGIARGLTRSLTTKLEGAVRSLEIGRSNDAANRLGAFINQLEAQSGKRIQSEEAVELILQAEMVMECVLMN
jgi:hypothetical protein